MFFCWRAALAVPTSSRMVARRLTRGGLALQAPVEAVLLRVFVGEDDRHGEVALYQAIVERALAMRMAGATVLPGPEGFGPSRHIRSELSVDAGPRQPMVVEIVDSEEHINRFLPVLDSMVESGLVTLEKVRVIRGGRTKA
jgi:uncharacterized protein